MSLSPKLLRLIIIGLLLMALPVTIFLVKQQQDLRSRAFDTVTLKLTPPTVTKNLNDPLFDVVVSVDGGNLDVSGVDIVINFNPAILEMLPFTPSGVYNSVLLNGPPNNTTGSIRIILANNSSTPIIGSNIVLGTLHFRGKAIGTSQVTFVPNEITASGRTTSIATANNTTGNYTISTIAPTPSPTPSASPGPTVSLILNPAILTKNLNEPPFDISLSLNAGSLDISGVDIRLTFNPAILEMLPFTPSNTYNSVLLNGPPDNTIGSFRYIAANNSSASISGNIQLGTIQFRGKALGTSQVTLFSNEITASGRTTSIATANNTTGNYTISTATPPPTPPAGAPTGVNITSLPSCLDAGSSLSTAQKQAARISWNSASSSFWVDMSSSSSFNPLYHKSVSGNTTDLTGFNKDNVFPPAEIDILPNTTYFVRVFDDLNNLHSSTIQMNIPQCGVVACSYQSTQVKFRLDDSKSWQDTITVSQNQTVSIAGFHNNNTTNLPTDISVTVVAPDYSFPEIPHGNNISFTPTKSGTYNVGATTNGQSGSACTAEPAGNLHVNPATSPTPPPVTTTSYKLAETIPALDSAPWQPYTFDPTETTFTFADKIPGAKQVCVQFKGSDGTVSTPQCQTLDLVTAPQITGCNLDFDPSGNLSFTILGNNFGTTAGTVKLDTVPISNTGMQWKNTEVKTGKLGIPETGTDFPITLTTSQGLSASVVCSSVSQLSLGAKLFCPQVTPRDITGVEVTIVEATTSGKTFKETATLSKSGVISPLKTQLVEGMGYRVGIKVPKSVRRVVEFIAARDTTNVDITPSRTNRLALGDIFPLDGGDGVINSADKSQMNREWVIDKSAKTSDERAADLNIDTLVNSFDWSCMRQDFGAEDDPLPQAGPLNASTVSTFTPNVTTNPSTSPSPVSSSTPTSTASPAPSPTPTPTPSFTPGAVDQDSDTYQAGPIGQDCPNGKKCDCDDSNSLIHPNQFVFFTTPRQSGGYDYDCSGGEDKQNGCTVSNLACTTASNLQAGYAGTPPACGVSGAFYELSQRSGHLSCGGGEIFRATTCGNFMSGTTNDVLFVQVNKTQACH